MDTDKLQKAKLINELVDVKAYSKHVFDFALGTHNPVICDVEYAKHSIPTTNAAYTQQNPGLPDRPFGAIYREGARIYAQKDLADIAFRAAEILYKQKGWNLKVMDCLRTIEGQEGMAEVVRANGWSEDYVSSPGAGAHPRAMAIDLVPVDALTGKEIDMGSAFDHFGEKSGRDYVHLTPAQMANRVALNTAMQTAATEHGKEIELLASEWWDFRFKKEEWSQYPALSDADLPNQMRVTDRFYEAERQLRAI